jgi:hypothetical protein
LFVCDDLNLLHKECLAILGESGHQVYYWFLSNWQYFIDFLRNIYTLCSNKQDEKSLTSIVYSSSLSAFEFSKEEKLLEIELELLRNVNWNFDANVQNSIYKILSEPKEKKIVFQRKAFDCTIYLFFIY